MPKQEAPLEYLQQYLPKGAGELIFNYLHKYKVHLTITKGRKSVLGDYRHSTHHQNHRISVNGNLNKFAFLITLIHELAHLLTFMEFGNRVQSHGREWKMLYRRMLEDFIKLNIFPNDILASFNKSLHNLPASSCADEDLMRVLKKYDANNGQAAVFVEQVPEGKYFKLDNGQVFQKGKKMRKRFQCTELATGKLYLFSPIFEVEAV
jgi:SprT protein